VRIGHSLNEAEINHVTSRRESAVECLKRHGIQCSPVIFWFYSELLNEPE